MKKSLLTSIFTLAMIVLTGHAWGATATATWTDFNTLTSDGFTLTKAAACNVNEDGSLTLGGAGLQYTFVSGDGMYANKNVSIVMDVTFPETIEGTMHLVNVKHTGGNAIGVATTSDTLQTLWNLDTGSRVAKTWSPTGRKTITITYSGGGNGTDVYVDGALVATDTSLKTSGTNLGVLTIGAYHDGTQAATGVIVHSIKMFASKLSTFDAEQQGFIDSMAWRASFNGANTTEGWITGWGGEAGDSYTDTITGQGYQIKSGCHPWVNYTVNKPFSIALYANVSEIANTDDKKAVLIALGNSGSNFVLAKTGGNTIAVCQGNEIVGELQIEDADIAVAGSYHLIVFGTDGTTSFLQVDGTKVSSTHDSAPTWNAGVQIGSMFQGVGDYVQGYGMIVDEVRGYGAALDDAALAKLTAKYSEYTPLYVNVEGETTYSALNLETTGATPLVITLNAGAVLTMDAAPTLRELKIVSEGTEASPATVLASVENPFANAESAKITGGETKIPATMYFNTSVNLSALNSVTLLAADGATTDAPQEITNVINVANGKTVKLEGHFNLSGNNQVQSGGTLVVASGSTQFNAANQGIKGTLTVAKGATLTSATTDDLAYDTAGVVVNVYGTLDLGATRWTIFANNNTLNLYAGATVTGAGQGTNGALDVWEKTTDSVAINVLKNGDDAADVTISAELRCRDGKTVFNIAEGMTAVIDNDNDPGTNGGGIKVTGAGTLKITSANTYSGGTVVDAGATLVVANTEALGSGSVSGTGKIIADTIALDVTGYTEFSGSYGVQNNGTLIVAAGKEGTIEVPAGSTVKLVLNDALFAAGYTASGVTGAGTIAFYKEGDLETVVQSGNTYGGSGAIWTPEAADSAWDTCWNVTEVPTSGGIAINTSNLEADISVTIPSNFDKITVNAHAEYITTITFADGFTAAPLGVAGKVKLPIAVINGVDVAVEDDSILIADVGGEATLTKALSGSCAFWKAGTGTLTLNANVAVDDGVEILAGTLKFGVVNGTKCTIGGTSYGTQGNVKVHTGATLDVNGVADAFLNMVTLCEGAVFANDSASELSNGSRQLKGITLEGNATVRATSNFGILANGYNETTLNLGGYTLTKTGDAQFWLAKTAVSDGTLKVENGNFTFVNTAPTFENVTFDSDLNEAFNIGNGAISGTVTKKGTGSLTLNGVISGSDLLSVEGGTLVLTAANTRTGNVTVASGATLDVSGETARLFSGDNHVSTPIVTLQGTLKTRDWTWAENSSFGKLAHNSDKFYINGGTIEFTAGFASERLYTIQDGGATFKVADGVTYTQSATDAVANSGTLNLTGNGTYKFAGTVNGTTAIAAGTTLAQGTFENLTFAAGAKLDASTGKLTVTGDVTLPAEGTVTVTLPTEAAAGTEVLACANAATLDLTKLSAAPAGLKWVAENGAVKLAVAKKTNFVVTVGEETVNCETVAEALDALAANGGSLQIAADADPEALALTETLTIAADTTIDLNGKTLTSTVGPDDPAIHVTGGTLTLTGEGSITAPYVVIQQGTKNAGLTTKVVVGKDVLLTSSRTEGEDYDGDNVVLLYGKATLESAGVLLTYSKGYAAIQGSGGDTGADTSITITGGQVVNHGDMAIYHPQAGSVTITGGVISGETGIEMRAGSLAMSGGTVEATAAYVEPTANSNGSTVEGAAIVLSQHVTGENVTANITGGTITATSGKTFVVANTTGADPVDVEATIGADVEVELAAAEVLIDTLMLTGDKTSGYTLGAAAAMIGEVKYATFEAAYADAYASSEAETITLLDDCTPNATVMPNYNTLVLAAGDSINLNGYTLTAPNLIGTLVINGGSFDTYNSNEEVYTLAGPENSIFQTSDGVFQIAIDYETSAVTLTAVSGELSLAKSYTSPANQTLVANADANITIPEGVTLTLLGSATVSGTLNCSGLIVLGAEGATLTAAEGLGDKITTTVDGKVVVYADGVYSVGEAAVTYVAQIGDDGEKFTSVTDALKAATSGNTVKLLADVTEVVVVPKGFTGTLDLGGKTLTGRVIATGAEGALITATVQNGSIYNEDSSKDAVIVEAYSTVTLKDLNVTGTKRHIVRVNANGNCIVESGTYTLVRNGAGCNILYLAASGAQMTVKGGTFVGQGGTYEDAQYIYAFQLWAGTALYVEGGNFTLEYQNLFQGASESNSIEVSGGTFKQDPSGYLADGYKIDTEVNAGYYTVVKQVLVAPGTPLEVEADDAAAALAMVDGVDVTVPEIDGLTADAYKAYFTLVATETATDKYTVSAVLDPDVVTPTIGAIAIGEGATITVAAPKPGLYYSVKTMTEVNGDAVASSTGTLATSSEALELTAKLPEGDKAFFKAAVDYK